MPLSEDDRYILSYYRTSEIGGSLFFGRLARLLRPSAVQVDMSRHFADEAQHAWYWTQCLQQLGCEPLKLHDAYQDRYNEAVGVPANLMEVLAITNVFERRVIGQYERHRRVRNLRPEIAATLRKIMIDEQWHIQWISAALQRMEEEYGRDRIAATVKRYIDADREVYAKTMAEHEDRVKALFPRQGGGMT